MQNFLGDVFWEEVTSEKKKKWRDEKKEKSGNSGRIFWFYALVIFGFGFLFVRLFFLTLIQGKEYRQLAEGNRIREFQITAPRGIIYERNGLPLVRNIPSFVHIQTNEVIFDKEKVASLSGYKEKIEREYIYGDLFAHVVGFTGEASQEEIRVEKVGSRIKEVKMGDKTGKMGIEKTYDSLLRGINGKELIEVDAQGRMIRTLGKVEALPGDNLTLTLDFELQKIAKEELQEKKGAIIVSFPFTGEILVLYSSPSFDPNNFIKGEKVEEILTSPANPLFNRVIGGTYPPGSTFKIVTALAALENQVIDKDTQFEDTGVLQVGEFSFGNWYFLQYGKKEGRLNIVSALKRSNDIFFYKVGELLGIERLADFAKKVGVGRRLGIEIEGEAEGLMPNPAWQKKVKGENWYLGNTYHVAIGQGDILVTPLQVNAWTNIIATNGLLCRPHLVKEDNQKTRQKTQNQFCENLHLKKEAIELVKEGMKQACLPGGTGWPLFRFKVQSAKLKADGIDFLETYEATTSGRPLVEIPVACKTGTAEYEETNKTHAWFTVFAPVYHPQISVTVLVEGGGEGASVAAPIAKKILEKWFVR